MPLDGLPRDQTQSFRRRRAAISERLLRRERSAGRIQVRHNGVALPCTIFDPHQQRVTHAAITDNKHLSAVLAHIKAEQDKAAASAEVRPESARNGYRKNGRRNNGWNTLADRKRNAARKASQGCDN